MLSLNIEESRSFHLYPLENEIDMPISALPKKAIGVLSVD